MSNIRIREYRQSDFLEIVACMEQLQDYIIELDPLKRHLRKQKYGLSYTKRLLRKIDNNAGKVFVAVSNKHVIGCICGIIQKQPNVELLEHMPSKNGRVLELLICPEFRSKGIGQMLMNKMETYFRNQKCTIICVEVFTPNISAHKFYTKLGYIDWVVDMVKT